MTFIILRVVVDPNNCKPCMSLRIGNTYRKILFYMDKKMSYTNVCNLVKTKVHDEFNQGSLTKDQTEKILMIKVPNL